MLAPGSRREQSRSGAPSGTVGETDTREALLAAAAVVFGESGYRNARVREICRKAGANVAAVNYHFGGKEALYAAVLKRGLRRMLERFPPDGGVPGDADPRDRLHGFVRSFLLRIFASGPDSGHGRLLAWEMIEPTPALDLLVRSEIRALAERLEGIVGELLGRVVEPGVIRACMASVVSQVTFFQHCRPVVSRLFPDLRFEPAQLEHLADHITRFSLAGIRRAAADAASAGATRGSRPARPGRPGTRRMHP